jgi:chromosome partitioning protein
MCTSVAATVISFGIQKGGVGKTTTTCVTSFILARNNKVLAIDMDSQGNLTEILTRQSIYDFEGKTVLNAIDEGDATSYIVEVSDNLHVLPADDILATIDRQVNDPVFKFRDMVGKLRDMYDFILIDCPPNLGTQTVASLATCDLAVVILQSEPLCFKALDRYLNLLQLVKREINPELRIGGILPTMLDSRTSLDLSIIDKAREDYEDWVFDVVIRRRSKLKEFTLTGISDRTYQDREALELYEQFVKELMVRCGKEGTVQRFA